MISFYTYTFDTLIFLVMLSSFSLLAQVVTTITSFNRHKKLFSTWLECVTQVIICAHLFIQTVLISQVFENLKTVLIADTGFAVLRYVIGIAMIISVTITIILKKEILPAVVLPALVFTLPWAEKTIGNNYDIVFLLALLFWLGIAIFTYIKRKRERKNQISAFSIKQAMDSLDSALMYYDEKGVISLMNSRMQAIMLSLTGEMQKNGVEFSNRIKTGESIKGDLALPQDELKIYRLEDEKSWLFRERKIDISGKTYYQLSAVDVTKRLDLIQQLKESNDELRSRSKQISDILDNIEAICREDEIANVSSKIHDSMAQKLAMMLRILRSGEDVDEMSLKAYACDLFEGWEKIHSDEGPGSIAELCKAYSEIGVTVVLDGEPPADSGLASFFSDFVREGIANAVRHGFATRVLIKCQNDDNLLKLSVENIGLKPYDSIVEGSGIASLRRKLTEIGGTLNIVKDSTFILSAVIDCGKQEERANGA